MQWTSQEIELVKTEYVSGGYAAYLEACGRLGLAPHTRGAVCVRVAAMRKDGLIPPYDRSDAREAGRRGGRAKAANGNAGPGTASNAGPDQRAAAAHAMGRPELAGLATGALGMALHGLGVAIDTTVADLEQYAARGVELMRSLSGVMNEAEKAVADLNAFIARHKRTLGELQSRPIN